jgi:hypothetical protein
MYVQWLTRSSRARLARQRGTRLVARLMATERNNEGRPRARLVRHLGVIAPDEARVLPRDRFWRSVDARLADVPAAEGPANFDSLVDRLREAGADRG